MFYRQKFHILAIFLITLLLSGATQADEGGVIPIPRAIDMQVDAGGFHTCGIRVDDTVRCWGDNTLGQTDVPDDLGMVRHVSAGSAHTCAVTTDDTLRCWGNNVHGQSTVPDDLGTVKMVSAGNGHTCAVTTDNTVRCWGNDAQGQSTVPGDLGTVKMVGTGDAHTCAVTTDNTLRCWGDNTAGQTDVPGDLGTVKMVSGGVFHTCAVTTDNTVRCWGIDAEVPDNLGATRMVSAGPFHTCAMKTDNTVRCWAGGQSVVPGDLGAVKMVSAGSYYNCAVKTDNTLRCWGDNTAGQATPPVPTIILGLTNNPLGEAGGTAVVYAQLSEYPWSNVSILLAFSGTAAHNVDYVPSGAFFTITPYDTAAVMTLTGIDDNLNEGDETIIVDIGNVAGGGTEDGTQQVAAIIQDDDVPTPTPTEPAEGIELVANGGFEAESPLPWVLKNRTGDNVKCDQPGKPVAHSGTCAFQFKGGTGENSKLQQTLDLTNAIFTAGDTLDLSLYVNAVNVATSGKVKLVVQYSDDTPVGKLTLNLASTTGYEPLTDSGALLSAAVSKIKLQVKHTSPAGKVYLDDVSITQTSASAFSQIVPLP
jgi:hypothetical protein